MLRFAVPIGTAKRKTSAKRKTMLRFARPPFTFWVLGYAVEIIITFCVKLLRFGLSSYVLGYVKFCGPTTLYANFTIVHEPLLPRPKRRACGRHMDIRP